MPVITRPRCTPRLASGQLNCACSAIRSEGGGARHGRSVNDYVGAKKNALR